MTAKPKMQKEEDHGLGVGEIEGPISEMFIKVVSESARFAIALGVSYERFVDLCHAAYDTVGGTAR